MVSPIGLVLLDRFEEQVVLRIYTKVEVCLSSANVSSSCLKAS
jgi:hypothetical protein